MTTLNARPEAITFAAQRADRGGYAKRLCQ